MKPVCVSTWCGEWKYFKEFRATARRNGIEPQNADSSQWKHGDWFRKNLAQVKYIREHAKEFSHFMFVDAYDVLFAAGWDEICRKYEAFKSPIVFGAECYCWPDTEMASRFPETPRRCRYINAGFWMAEAGAALHFAVELSSKAAAGTQCDQSIVRDMFLSGKYPMKLDYDCSILHCCNLDSMDFIIKKDGRITNTETGETPCLFHGNGGGSMQKVIEWL